MRTPRRLTAALFALTLGACGAGEDDPAPANPLPAATCPPLEQLAPSLLGHVRAGHVAGLRRVVESLDPDEIAVLLDGVLRLVKGLEQRELLALLELGEHEKLQALLPLVVDLLRAIGGDPANPGSFRADVVAELARVVHRCDFDRMFSAVDHLLGSPELPEMLTRLAEVLRTPFVQELLRSDASGALGPEGFVRIVMLVLERMAAPDFDFSAFRAVLAGVPALRSEEPPLVGMLASLERMLSDPELFPPLQDLTCCYLYDRPTCAAAAGGATLVSQQPAALLMMYDLFVDQAANLDALLDSVADLAGDPTIERTLDPLRLVLRQLAASDDIRGKLVRLLELLLEPDHAREVLPELVLLLDSGATNELLAIAGAILEGCDPREAE